MYNLLCAAALSPPLSIIVYTPVDDATLHLFILRLRPYREGRETSRIYSMYEEPQLQRSKTVLATNIPVT